MTMEAVGGLAVDYIAGSQRSGTTLVARSLGRRADSPYIGELRQLWLRGEQEIECGCGQARRACPVWSTVFPSAVEELRLIREMRLLEEDLYLSLPPWRRPDRVAAIATGQFTSPALVHFRRRLLRLYWDLGHALGDTPRVVDGSKTALIPAVLMAEGWPVTIHWIVSEPRGVVASMLRRRAKGATRMSRLPAVARASMSWAIRQEEYLALARVATAPLIHISYSDVVREEGSVRLCASHDPISHGKFSGEEEVVLTEDMRWRSELSLLERTVVRTVTTPSRRRLDGCQPMPAGSGDGAGVSIARAT